MAQNKLSSTNIAEILEAQITAMKKINDVIVGTNIDENMLNNIVKTVKPLQDVMKALISAADMMSKIKLNGVFANIKFKIGLNQFLSNLVLIANSVSNIEVDKNSANKMKNLAMCTGSLEMIAESLNTIAKLSIGIALMRKMILKTIDLALEINEKIANSKVDNSDSKMLIALANGLAALSSSLLLFVTSTMFGLVPVLATVAMLAIKVFLNVYISTFNEKTIEKIQTTEKAISQLSISIIALSSAVLLLALTGILVKENIVSIGFVVLYCVTVLGIFYLVSLIVKKLDELNVERSILYISAIILGMSITVMVLALTGQLIKEEWKNFGMVALFFIIVAGVFMLIDLTVQFMKELGSAKQLMYIASIIAILSFSVILLSLAGQLISEEWKNFEMVSLFLLVVIGAFMLVGLATKFIKEGAKNMLYIAITVGILVLIMYLLIPIANMIDENWDNILNTFIMLGIMVAAVIGVAFASKLIQNSIMPMIMISIAMIIMSASLLIIAKASDYITWEAFGMFMLIVGGLTGIAIGLGVPVVAALAYTGAGVLIAIGAAFLIFATSLNITVDAIKTVKELNLDPVKDKDIIKQPIEIIWKTIEYAAKLKTATLLKGIAKIIAIGDASSSISNMADTVQKFAELKIPTRFDKNGKAIAYKPMTEGEFNLAASNIAKIITCILQSISNEDITNVLENLSKKAIKNIGLIIDNTAGVVNLIDAIEKAVKFDESTISKGVDNIKLLITKYAIALQELFIGTGEVVKKEGWFGKTSYKLEITGAPELDISKLKNIETSLKSVSKIVEMTSPILENIQQFSSEIDNVDPSKISNVINSYITSLYGDENGNGGIRIGEDVAKRNGQIMFIIEQQEKLSKIDASTLQKNTDNFIKFINKANSVDSNKLKSIRDMFEQMSRFSESISGNFDKLADVLNNELIEILEKLNGTLIEIKDKPMPGQSDAQNNKVQQPSIVGQLPQQQTQKEIAKQEVQKEKKISANIEQNIANIKSILERFEQAGWGIE